MEEGVIQFKLRHTLKEPLRWEDLQELESWRQQLRAKGLVGQDPTRYGGYGFGNLSRRLLGVPGNRFVITGSQTGSIPRLTAEHYTVVLECSPTDNRVVSEGPIHPSSESLTHGILYALDDAIRWVMHVHSPVLWNGAALLGLPTTDPRVPQGTPAMAREVQRLFAKTEVRQRRIFAMGGHVDGLIAFGTTASEAGNAVLKCS